MRAREGASGERSDCAGLAAAAPGREMGPHTLASVSRNVPAMPPSAVASSVECLQCSGHCQSHLSVMNHWPMSFGRSPRPTLSLYTRTTMTPSGCGVGRSTSALK